MSVEISTKISKRKSCALVFNRALAAGVVLWMAGCDENLRRGDADSAETPTKVANVGLAQCRLQIEAIYQEVMIRDLTKHPFGVPFSICYGLDPTGEEPISIEVATEDRILNESGVKTTFFVPCQEIVFKILPPEPSGRPPSGGFYHAESGVLVNLRYVAGLKLTEHDSFWVGVTNFASIHSLTTRWYRVVCDGPNDVLILDE